jgi:hypothetical protein
VTPVQFTEPLEIQKQVLDKDIPRRTVVKVTSCGANRWRCATGKFVITMYYYTMIERENLSVQEIHIQLPAILVDYSRHLHIEPI